MNDDYILQVGTFVDLLNGEFENNLKNTADAYFRIENLRSHFLFGVRRQKIVLDNMYSPATTGFYGSNIERVADFLHTRKKYKYFSIAGIKKENLENLEINIIKPIELGQSKIIKPQKFTLNNIYIYGEDITYLEQLKGLRQLAYENGFWKFAD